MSTAILSGQVAARTGADARGALAGLSLSMLLSSLGTSAANVALPALAGALGASFAEIQWVVLAYLLAVTVSIVSVGHAGDLVGRQRLLRLGLALFVVASALCGVAPTLGALVAARALQGLAGAVLMALSVALVGESVPQERTGSAMGLLGTMSAVGTALGPSLGGLLLAAAGWRAIFLVNVPLGLLALLLTSRLLPAPPGARRRAAFDRAGTLLLAATLSAYALAMTVGPGRSGAALLLAALGAAGLFARVEGRASAPLVQIQVLRAPELVSGLASSALVATVIMATLVVGPFYLAHGLGLEVARVGLAMSTGPLVAALCGVPSGRLVDRFGASRMGLAGLVGMLAGCVLVATTSTGFGALGYLAPLALLTGSYALFQTANNTSVMLSAGADHRGAISGLLSLSRNLGLITGTAAMGAVFVSAAGADVATAGPGALAHGLRVTFGVAAGVIVAALGLAVRALRGAPGR